MSNKLINQREVSKYLQVGGVRIEDTILVTSTKAKVLSSIPKEIIQIEEMMNSNKNKKSHKKKI